MDPVAEPDAPPSRRPPPSWPATAAARAEARPAAARRLRRLLDQRGDAAGAVARRAAARDRRAARRPARRAARRRPSSAWRSPARASSTCSWPTLVPRRAGDAGRGGRPTTAPAAAASTCNVEFVSANPTGPITIASGRHAAYGDSLARILEFAGHRVEREYYVNDAGSQVRALRRVDPGARARRGAAGGRLPGRLRGASSRSGSTARPMPTRTSSRGAASS